ncbi:MAG: beta-lactamase family protein [Lachnospiraceae bacterium]|nr:beta-lactamase family protein [Lachnospiraceae bacterium]
MFHYSSTIDNLVNHYIAAGEIAGASLLVLKDGEEKYRKVYGESDKERHIPMRQDTIFHMYSMSKPVTAAAVMILFERGELDIRDAVCKYLPCFRNMTVWTEEGEVPAKRDFTIWDCLNMTTGIPYPCEELETGRRMDKVFRKLIARREAGEVVDTMEWMQEIAKLPLVFQPGEQWMYGFSADILGAVVEAVSGKKFGQFLQEEIFAPLGMTDTGFFVPEEKWDRFAVAYEWDEAAKGLHPLKRSHLGEYYKSDVAFESGGAGMVSTIDDYAKFAQMLLNKGKLGNVRILGEKTVEFMAQNHLTEEQRTNYNWDSVQGYGYGCLMRCLEDKGLAGTNGSIGEFGWDGWTGNYVTVNPEENLVLLFFIQRCGSGFWELTRKFRAVTYGALESL